MSQLKRLDKRPQNLSLPFNKIENYKSITGGCLSLVYIILGLSIFFTKMYGLYEKDHITFGNRIIKENDHEQIDISSANFSLAIQRCVYNSEGFKQKDTDLFCQFESIQNMSKCLRAVRNIPIKFSELGKYGLEAYAGIHSFRQDKQGNLFEDYSQKALSQCSDNQYRACLPTQILSQSMVIKGRLDYSRDKEYEGQIYRRYSMIIRKCSIKKNECNESYAGQFAFKFYLYNNQIIANATQTNETVKKEKITRVFQSHTLLNSNLNASNISASLNLFFKKAVIETDQSILPKAFHKEKYIINTTWFYDEEYFEETFPVIDNILLQIYLKRSAYTHIYTRQYERLDQVLGEIFGLLSLIGILIFGVYQGYNNWSYEQYIKKAFGQEYEQPNILKYYRSKIKRVLRIKRKKRVGAQSQEAEEQAKSRRSLDIYELVRTCERMQNKIIRLENILNINTEDIPCQKSNDENGHKLSLEQAQEKKQQNNFNKQKILSSMERKQQERFSLNAEVEIEEKLLGQDKV